MQSLRGKSEVSRSKVCIPTRSCYYRACPCQLILPYVAQHAHDCQPREPLLRPRTRMKPWTDQSYMVNDTSRI